MEKDKIYLLKNKHWVYLGDTHIELLCPNDMTPMRQVKQMLAVWDNSSVAMCPDCGFDYQLDIQLEEAKQDVFRMIGAQRFRKMEMIDIDGINTPILKKKAATKDGKYFASVQINESKRGPQLVIYAGEKGRKEKSQIFVTPETKKMSFDHKDAKPTDIFTRVTADFIDGSSNEIKQSEDKE